MRRILLFLGSFLLLVSSLWASRIFLDELKVLPGGWTQLGENLIAARGETVRTALSGDGRTLVKAVTGQVGDDDGVVNARGSLSIYRREGMGWVQVGEPIEDNIGPIDWLADVSYDGSLIAYRFLNNFLNFAVRDGGPVSEWNAKWVATDPAAPGGVCEVGAWIGCPGLSWQTVGNVDQGGDVLALSITGNDAYSFYLESASPPDMSLSAGWSIRLRMAVPPTGADGAGSTDVTVGIDCPSGCEQTAASLALPHNRDWVTGTINLHAMSDTDAFSITNPVVIELPENLRGAVVELSTVSFTGNGSAIRVIEQVGGVSELVWTFTSGVYEPSTAQFSRDGRNLLVSGFFLGNVFDFGPAGYVLGHETCLANPLMGVNEVFELSSGLFERKGPPICGQFLGLELYGTLDAAAETLAIGRINLLGLPFGYPNVQVFSFLDGSWSQVFAVSGHDISDSWGNYAYPTSGDFLPQLSEDGTALLVGDANYSLVGSSAGYDFGSGTYQDAAPNAGRIRRYEKSDEGWREAGVPLIGNAGDRLQLGYPRGLSADGARVVTHTGRVPAIDPEQGSSVGAGVAGKREIVVFGESIVLPDDLPAMTLPSVLPRQLAEGETPRDTLKQSIKVLQWKNDTWYQAGSGVEVEHAAADVYFYSSISADGQLIAASHRFQCTDPSCLYPPAPDNYLSSSSTYSFTGLTDLITLESLYIGLDGFDWHNNLGWFRDESPCAWFGVLCDSNGFVTSLRLEGNNLSGSIPDSLGNLRYLQSLDLSNNYLAGELPASLGQLQDLSQIFVNDAELSGVIDTSFGQLTQLETIDLSGNRLSGDVSTFAGMSELKFLDIAGNAISGNFPSGEIWPAAEHINLSSNALSGELPSSISASPKLRFLNLRGNSISGRLPASLEYLDTLQTIDLSNNALSGQISESLGTYLAARELALAGNAFNCPYPSALTDYFSREREQCVPPNPPAAPVIIRSDYGDREIVLVVTVPADGGAAVSLYNAFCTDGGRVYVGSSNTTRIEVTGLTNGFAYTCYVTASNSAGVSAASSNTGPITPEELNSGLPIWLLHQLTRSEFAAPEEEVTVGPHE